MPKIHHKIEQLDLEALSMKRLLLATDYPNLRGLSLHNLVEETDGHIFTGKT
jgi:hypothetical protein